jgi:butyryl-CoA dehydrogenase
VSATDGEAEAWRGRARAFAEERVAPVSERIDREDRVPPELLRELAQRGFMGLGLPEAYGGRPAGSAALAAVLEEIGRANAALATMLSVHLSVAAAPIDRFGTPEQRERFLRPLAEGRELGAFALTEPSAGSDAASLRCRYVAEDGGYRLTGTKTFITDADLAGIVLAFATRDPSLGHRGVTAFVVPAGTAGFSVAARLPKLGLHGSTTTEIVFDGAHLPADQRLGEEGRGFGVAMEALTGGRIGIAACALGTARAAFEAMREAVAAQPEDWKRAELARAYVELEASSALVRAAAAEKDAGRPFVRAASAAKLAASRAAVRIASRGLDVAGRPAASAGSVWERLLRDARVFPIVEGTTEIQELILGRELLSP